MQIEYLSGYPVVKVNHPEFGRYNVIGLVKLGKGMLFSVEQAFVGRDKIQAPLQMPAVTHACIIAYPTSQYPKGYNCHLLLFFARLKKDSNTLAACCRHRTYLLRQLM